MNAALTDAILDILATSNSRFCDDATGRVFEAVTETDLISALRDRGWKLPPAGFFMSEVHSLGFSVRQGGSFKGKVRRAFKDGRTGRALSDYQTICYL